MRTAKPNRRWCRAVLPFVLLFAVLGVVVAQEQKAGGHPQSSVQQSPATQTGEPQAKPKEGINEEFGVPLAEESREAAKEAETGDSQEKMIEELKASPSVRWMSNLLHIDHVSGYWVGIGLDFVILALLIGWGLKKSLPATFRARTNAIKKGIEEARRASEDANQRLAKIEERLAKLDDEVSAMRAAAEKEAAEEEQRILAAAEQDKQRIVAAAESEIAAAAKMAQRDLKAFAADLAVSLAERRIHVDQATDQALVRSFSDQLGVTAGKDGN